MTKPGGKLYIIGTWKIDVKLMAAMFPDAEQKGEFWIAKLSA